MKNYPKTAITGETIRPARRGGDLVLFITGYNNYRSYVTREKYVYCLQQFA